MKRKNYLVHDEGNIAREGDIVRIESCRPLSARKSFAIAEIRKNKGSQFAKYDELAKKQVFLEENQKTQEFLNKRQKTEEEIKQNKSLISDLTLIHKGATTPEGQLSGEESQKIAELKEQYGIKSWPPQSEALQLEIQSLRHKIESLQEVINFVEPTLKVLLEDSYKEKVDAVLKEQFQKEPESLKKNIRKNLLRKYLLTRPDAARSQFGDVIESVKSQ